MDYQDEKLPATNAEKQEQKPPTTCEYSKCGNTLEPSRSKNRKAKHFLKRFCSAQCRAAAWNEKYRVFMTEDEIKAYKLWQKGEKERGSLQ